MPNTEQIEEFVTNGQQLLYAEDAREGVLSILQSSEPAEGIGTLALMVVKQLEQSLGGQANEEVLLAGAVRLVADIAEFAQEAGLYEVDEQIIQLAIAYAVQEYIKEGLASGKYTEEELMQSVQQIEQEGATEPSGAAQDVLIQDEGVGMPLQEQEPQRGLL